METVILRDLTVGYRQGGAARVVASSLNASLCSGELTCLLGQNGTGKSTLLRTLAAFQRPLGGEVVMRCSLPGHDVPAASGGAGSLSYVALSALTDRELSRLIGIVLTEKPDVRGMTADELVAMGRSPYTDFWGRLSAADRDIVARALRQVGISQLASRQLTTLSDGERQKVMIAKALAQQTPVIYLDEPTAFLDYPSKVETMLLLRRLAIEEQKSILLSTHDVELSLQLADRLWLMHDGQLHVGTPRQLAQSGRLSRFVDRDGIALDTATLRIDITKQPAVPGEKGQRQEPATEHSKQKKTTQHLNYCNTYD